MAENKSIGKGDAGMSVLTYIVLPKGDLNYHISFEPTADGGMAILLNLPDGSIVSPVVSAGVKLNEQQIILLLKRLDDMLDEDGKTPLIANQHNWAFVMRILIEQGLVKEKKYTEFRTLLIAAKVRTKTLASVDALSRTMQNFCSMSYRFPNWKSGNIRTPLYLKGLRIAEQCLKVINELKSL